MNKKIKHSTNLVSKIDKDLQTKSSLVNFNSLVVALSGGQDSTCLLFLLIQIKNKWDWILFVGHCNHLWQKDSIYLVKQSLKLCFVFKISSCFSVTSQSVPTEQKARDWRYQSLQRISQIYQTFTLVTGHTATDRIETLVYNLGRGSGTLGLLAFSLKKNIVTKYFKSKKIPFPKWCFSQYPVTLIYKAHSFDKNLLPISTQYKPLVRLALQINSVKLKQKWTIKM